MEILTSFFTPIERLLSACRPSAIFRAVVSAVVDSINTASRRAWAHVFKERLEASYPSVAHCDSAASVVFPSRAPWSQTSVFHSAPRDVFSGRPTGGGMAVGLNYRQPNFRMNTAAATGIALTHRVGGNRSFISAIAYTEPVRFRVIAFCAAKNG